MEGSLLAPLMNSSSDSLPEREEKQNGNKCLKSQLLLPRSLQLKKTLLTEATYVYLIYRKGIEGNLVQCTAAKSHSSP